jgi:glycosyltransferase involved in cell wall biosynthesis
MPEPHRPRVLQIVADGKAGGGTTFVLGLSEHLRDCGYQVTLITEPDSYAAQQARQLGLDLCLFDFFKWPRGSASHGQCRRAMANTVSDLVHFHGPRAALPGTWGMGLRQPAGASVVYTVHGYHFRNKPVLPRMAGQLAEHLIQHRADVVVHVSAADAAFAQRSRFAAVGKSQVILNGVAAPTRPPPELAARDYDVVFAARLVRQKNPVFAAQVLRRLAEAGLKVGLVGDGELRADVHAVLAGSPVPLLGALSHQAATAVLANSRILLFPSLWEGLPLTPMEAMISGGVVVASNIEGNNEVVQHDRTGLLIDPFDVDAYAAQIQALLRNPVRMQAMATRARQVAHQRFAKRRCFDEYTALYQRLLGQRSQALL